MWVCGETGQVPQREMCRESLPHTETTFCSRCPQDENSSRLEGYHRAASCTGPASIVFPKHLLLVSAAHRLLGELHF